VRVPFLVVAVVTAMLAGCGEQAVVRPVAGGEARLGKRLIEQYQCGACHAIPGVAAAVSNAAPSLAGFSRRSYIAGRIPNLADPLTRWLVDPPAMKSGTMMPNLNVSEAEARHMAAYLYTLR